MNIPQLVVLAPRATVAFPAVILKKLNGVPLLKHAIEQARSVSDDRQVIVLTDSEEACLLAQREGVDSQLTGNLLIDGEQWLNALGEHLVSLLAKHNTLCLLWPYTPLLERETLRAAIELFQREDWDVLTSCRPERHRIFEQGQSSSAKPVAHRESEFLVEVRGFTLVRSGAFNQSTPIKIGTFALDETAIEIQSQRDWWICEKLLRRRNIVLRVIGNAEVGMGHIYRCLSIAHEISDHSIYFICDENSRMAVEQIAGADYWVRSAPANQMTAAILELNPALVVHDVLGTEERIHEELRAAGVRSVSFEDLGPGATKTDLTINELYDTPLFDGNHILWGSRYFFLREEFYSARPHGFGPVSEILISFGGTDVHDLTAISLDAIWELCADRGIRIHIVTGPGYSRIEQLKQTLRDHPYRAGIQHTCATGIMSRVMETTQLAICSNGRTVYELAHMHIPAVVVSNHEREQTHLFSTQENGFANVGLFRAGETGARIREQLNAFIENDEYRRTMFERTCAHSFRGNRQKVVNLLLDLLGGAS